jgi:hypothetical protein
MNQMRMSVIDGTRDDTGGEIDQLTPGLIPNTRP